MASAMERFRKAFNNTLLDGHAEGYCSTMRALVSNEGKINIVHVAVHKALLESGTPYKDQFNAYAKAYKDHKGVVNEEVEALEKAVGRSALKVFLCG